VLGQALRDLLADPLRREVCAITSVDRVRTRYSWDRVAAEVVRAYPVATGEPHSGVIAKRS
jgi:D-inositol-3-phosphate glycosyltransferase